MGYVPYIGFNIFVSIMSIFTLNIGMIHTPAIFHTRHFEYRSLSVHFHYRPFLTIPISAIFNHFNFGHFEIILNNDHSGTLLFIGHFRADFSIRLFHLMTVQFEHQRPIYVVFFILTIGNFETRMAHLSHSKAHLPGDRLFSKVPVLFYESAKFVNVQQWFINGLTKIQKKEKTKLLQMILKNQIATKVSFQ